MLTAQFLFPLELVQTPAVGLNARGDGSLWRTKNLYFRYYYSQRAFPKLCIYLFLNARCTLTSNSRGFGVLSGHEVLSASWSSVNVCTTG